MMTNVYLDPQVIPDSLLNLMPRQGVRQSQSDNGEDGVERVLEGSRNDILASLAGTMRRNGLNQTGIEEGLLALNLTMCSPALAVDEVLKIAHSVANYPIGPGSSANNLSHALGQPLSEVRLERVNCRPAWPSAPSPRCRWWPCRRCGRSASSAACPARRSTARP